MREVVLERLCVGSLNPTVTEEFIQKCAELMEMTGEESKSFPSNRYSLDFMPAFGLIVYKMYDICNFPCALFSSNIDGSCVTNQEKTNSVYVVGRVEGEISIDKQLNAFVTYVRPIRDELKQELIRADIIMNNGLVCPNAVRFHE